MMRPSEPKQPALFAYQVNLEHRVPADHPLRRIKQVLDLSFVEPAVRHTYGRTGHPSVPPQLIMRMMFLLFYYNLPSERELMEQIRLRLDFLWFLDLDLDSAVPDHSVLSKARTRWGPEIFERLFTRTVEQCVAAGLVNGQLLHIDSTIVAADAAKDSVASAAPELIEALRQNYQAQERKLTVLAEPPVPDAPPSAAKVNDTRLSTTDPDARLARDKSGVTRLAYKEHRMVDDARGVITAVATTLAIQPDGGQLPVLYAQHQTNTGLKLAAPAVAGDRHYGTADNYRFCLQAGLRPHLGEAVNGVKGRGLFEPERFVYEAAADRFRCPAGNYLVLHQRRPEQQTNTYLIQRPETCAHCPLRAQCTRAKAGRSLQVPTPFGPMEKARREAHGPAARRSRKRRQHVMEGSFAQAANNHGAKRARWRRLWRQQIQSWLIVAVQNLQILLKETPSAREPRAAALAIKTGGATAANCRSGGVTGWWSARRPQNY